MSEDYIVGIRVFSGDYAPAPTLSENEALFSLIAKIYGGDGITTFVLSNLRGRIVIRTGKNLSDLFGQKKDVMPFLAHWRCH